MSGFIDSIGIPGDSIISNNSDATTVESLGSVENNILELDNSPISVADNEQKRKSSYIDKFSKITNSKKNTLYNIAANYYHCIWMFKYYLKLLDKYNTGSDDDTNFIESLKKTFFKTFEPFGDIYKMLNIPLGTRYNPGSYKAEFKYPLYNRNIQPHILNYIKSINPAYIHDITISHNILLNDKLRKLYNEYHNITYNEYKDRIYSNYKDYSQEVLNEVTDFEYSAGGTKKYKSKRRKTRKFLTKRKKSKKGAK
jgi:hypothetical protein